MPRFSPAVLLRCVLAAVALGPAAALGFDGNKAKRAEWLGDRQFRILVDWEVLRPVVKDLSVKMFFYRPQISRLVKIGFQVDRRPKPGTSTWRDTVTTGQDWKLTIPDDCPAGEYDVLVALGDKNARPTQRVRMLGDEDPERRYRLGTLVLEGNKQKLTGLRLEPGPGEPALAKRLRPNTKPTAFGPIQTSGALRCVIRPDRLVLTPLPDEAPFSIELDPAKLLGRAAQVDHVTAVDSQGKKLRDVKSAFTAGRLTFSTAKDEFAYEVTVR